MKAFSNQAYMLANARLEVRIAYTGFLALVLVGLATMAAFEFGHVGPLPSDIATYFRGGERAGAMVFPKNPGELLELTHAHAFVMGTVYLILAHLIIATTAPAPVKRWSVVAAFAGLAADVVGVWLIRYVSALFAYTQLLAWIAQWAGLGALVYYPLRDMWFFQEDDDDDAEDL
jgi:hypothetical protein